MLECHLVAGGFDYLVKTRVADMAAYRIFLGEVLLSPVYRTRSVGFDGTDFLNAAAVIDSDLDPFALNDWLHALDDVLLRRARGELALPAWFNLGFEQL